ncbi:conserved Plasmodium protein, unknown function [Plasmodium knowlesi strain H]|uniref:Uncharacterized protein n=3 Tax=Plasmodium knowlesi TaxID=5850 RepID=A0A5K1UTX5_PLAKH|nr:conserved Plasmodium protein, unknown function [Plasmodium knowlesi strain H]OTN65378.1 Uncharacterized protein PKNOH_S110115400 [Plasmodium knowlesi]CAA9989770.1 conserved Plasmodium protein, unknown function [Plasmodium knowlesi strain H]SBO22948.1 conserved Plasmodium protein, unknown function [Plasmodium knowlesi strain H]SBO22949.1 conserved Plasmodium protein, unknown function [Plasmodium knowlesi strain H]VVS79244.1 conserved Plasmodium protein, unknown function [Plasmodium knowlesi |eukprot:XP_002260493.1 hypothetical protein, conserved in Plasmodium species [Plasmodium knowlesi strain H]
MDDDKLSSLIQKIGHNIDDIRDRSMIMLIQKYEKSIISETDFKKRNYFFDIILRYINDRNSSIPLKALIHILDFVRCIIEKDQDIKSKFEQFGIHAFTKEFLTHFRDNEDRYKKNSAAKKLNVQHDIDNNCLINYEQMQMQNSNNEYNQVVRILNQLIRTYNGDNPDDFSKWDTQKYAPNVHVNNTPNDLSNANGEAESPESNEKLNTQKTPHNKNNVTEKTSDMIDLNKEEGEYNVTRKKSSSIKEKTCTPPRRKEHSPEKAKENTKKITSSRQDNTDSTLSQKDLLNISQIMEKNNCINIFTKNNFSKSEDFEYYNSLYEAKNEVNKRSIYLLLTYKIYKANKIREGHDNLKHGSVSTRRSLQSYYNCDECYYSHILNKYTFFYLYNFFDCFDVFRRNFLDINGVEHAIEGGDPIKGGVRKNQQDRSKEGENFFEEYFTYLNNKHVYNKSISYKIKNYINKMNLLHFYLSMKFNYFECLGMNIIKKIVSIDDLIYMHKEVNKILNEYIYIFNKDIFLFNYKFVYTLSYNIHYIYKNYVENNQAQNEFHHMNNLLNSLAYLIFIIIYSLYISVTQSGGGCLCNNIHNIYLNNFFFLINQNVFYLLLLRKGGKSSNSSAGNQIGPEFKYGHNRNKVNSAQGKGPPQSENNANQTSGTDDLNSINSFYLRKNEERAIRKSGDSTSVHFNEGDTYYYLFITKNNCVYFFKVLIFFMLEILKFSHCKISSIKERCTTLNFHIDNFVVIYNFLCNVLEYYFDEPGKKKDSHLEILIDYIEENNLHGHGDKKAKQNGAPHREYLSENLSIQEINSFSSSSSNSSSDLRKNKFQSIDMFTNSDLRKTYKYSPKQLELLKIVCLYINYTPVSFILMKKIQPKLVDLFRRFLFDMHLNTHHLELLHFFKIFFFFYDYEIYKEYIDFLCYFYSLANLFFLYRGVGGDGDVSAVIDGVDGFGCFRGSAFRSDISTFINTSNNISHFFFFVPTSYCALNGFLQKYHTENTATDLPAPHANEMFSNPADAKNEPSLEPLETFKSQDFFDAPNSEKIKETVDAHGRHDSEASHCIKKFCHVLLQIEGDYKKEPLKNGQCKKERCENQMDNFTHQESHQGSATQGDLPKFDAHFIDKITQVLVENSLRILFNSLSLLSSEYNNLTNYVQLDKQEKGSMYQFIVNKLKGCRNKMYILTFNHKLEGRTNVSENIKFVELFKNFVLLLHNIISIMYSYNTEIIFFLFNFIFNINYEKGSFDWNNNELSGDPQGAYPFVQNYNYQMGWGNQRGDLSYGDFDHNTISEKNIQMGNVPKNVHMADYSHSKTNLMSQNNSHNVVYSHGKSNQPEPPKVYEDTQYIIPILLQKDNKHAQNEEENHFVQEKGNNLLGTDPSQKYTYKNVDQFDQQERIKWESSERVNSKFDGMNQTYVNNWSNNDIPWKYTPHGGKTKIKSRDFYTRTFQINEFVDVIYELCVYSKKEIRNYYLFFIIENIKKKVETLFESLKDKELKEKKRLLSNIKLSSKVLLFLYYSKKKYILLLEQAAYSSFNFLYDHHFEPILGRINNHNGKCDSAPPINGNGNGNDNHNGQVPRVTGGKQATEQKALTSLAYFYKNVFLNVHSLYFLLFQRKKKKRTLSLKIMWKLHHQFRLKFTKWWGKTKKDASPNGTMKREKIQNCIEEAQHNIREEGEATSKYEGDTVGSHTHEPNRENQNHHQQKQNNQCHNTFNYSNDWKFNTNMLNMYISHFVLNHIPSDEEVIIQALQKVDMETEELSLNFFDHVMSFILKRTSKLREGDTCVENTTESKSQKGNPSHMNHFLLLIYEKIKSLYTKLIGEMLAKEQTSRNNIESFVYVLKILILLIITNYRNSNICKRIYKERYFYLSHLFCFFFYDNEIVRALSISLSFYLIFDQNILLLNKHRIFLEPHLLQEEKCRKGEMGLERDEYSPNWLTEKINLPHHTCTNMLENSLINEVKVEYMEGYYKEGRKSIINKCGDGEDILHRETPKMYDNIFFNLHRNRYKRKDTSKNKYFDKEIQANQMDDVNKASFHIEKKILFFLPFWLYKKLQPNNFLLNVKKLKSFFSFSTKYSYLHEFHDAKLNSKAKELSFYGNYNADNIFRSYFLFLNKYYHLSRRLSTAPIRMSPSGTATIGSSSDPLAHRSCNQSIWRSIIESNDKLETPRFPISNVNSFLFLNAKVDIKHTSVNGSTSYISNLIKVLKVLPPINDSADKETNFSYIYNLNELFFYLNNCYMQLLCTEGSTIYPAEGWSAYNQVSYATGEESAKRDDVQVPSTKRKNILNGSTQKNNEENTNARSTKNKQTHYLLQSDYDEMMSAIHFVYTTIFPYINKLLFFMYNQLTINNKGQTWTRNVRNETSASISTSTRASVVIHSNLLLLKYLISILDVCLYIQLILEKKRNMEGKIHHLDNNIDLSLFVYKLLFISFTTSSLKNKISSFSLNLLYNFVHLDNYYVRMKNSCHDNLAIINDRLACTNPIDRTSDHLDDSNFNLIDDGGGNPMLLKEQRRIRNRKMERRKNLSILVNFLFFILSKYRKRKKKVNKGDPTEENANNNVYSNIINVYEMEKTINVENATFQNHEQQYLKLDIYFVKNVLSMLHVVLRRGYFFDVHLVNEDLLSINMEVLMQHDFAPFTQRREAYQTKLKGTLQNASEENADEGNKKQPRSDKQEMENNNVGTYPKGRINLRIFKQIFLNKYMSTLINFCNIYNDIIIECLHIQLLLLFFKYILQVFKYQIWKQNLIKDSNSSKQHILVHFLKYYKADKDVCKFIKRIYFVILKYAIYMQNIRISEDVHIPFNGEKNIPRDKDAHTSVDQQSDLINKHNYQLKEEAIYKNYCQLFYNYTISKFKNCLAIHQDDGYMHPSDHYEEEDDYIKERIYKHQQNQVANSNYICMIDMYCPQCEETKILFLSIVLFLSFLLDNFPFFFFLNGRDNQADEGNIWNHNTKDNMGILCERIFHYLGKKNIYINFYNLKEAKLFEKYFFKIFVKLLFCNERETMNNLQKYKIYFYNRKLESTHQGGKTDKTAANISTSSITESQPINLKNSDENKTNKDNDIKKGGKQMDTLITDQAYTHHLQEEGSPIFTQNISHDNHFYLNHFLNYFLFQKKKKNNLELIYDKIYYYILIVSMCFKDRNFLALLLSQNENFFLEFNRMIQHYLKYVLKNKQEINKKKKKNEVMIHNLLYIFVSYIYIYLNELYNIFFTQIKNVLTLPSFFQNIIYVDRKTVDLNGREIINTHIKPENTSVEALYNTLISMKKKNWNQNLENYTDENIKNVVVHNIFHNNNIYLFILYIINDNKYNDKTEGGSRDEKKLPNRIVSSCYEENHQCDCPQPIHLDFKKNDKIFLNKITTNIVLFFLLFFYDYYSFNYEIKENILMQIARHILEHFATLYNSDLLNIHLNYAQMLKTANLKRKKTQLPGQSLCRINRYLKKSAGDSPSKETTAPDGNRQGEEKIYSSHQKFVKCSRASIALARIREEGRKKRGEMQKGQTMRGDAKMGDAKMGDAKMGDAKMGDAKMGDAKMGDAKMGEDSHYQNAHNKDLRYDESCPPEEQPPCGTPKEPSEPGQEAQPHIQLIIRLVEKLKRNKKLLFLYTINCFRIIQTYSNVSSLMFKYKYISTLLQKLAYLTEKNVVESVWNSFHFYLNSNNKNEITAYNEKDTLQVDKEIGYLSYMYLNYLFKFMSCFLLYDVATLYMFCSNMLNGLDTLNSHLKELMDNKKGTYLCSVILKFYLTITNSYFFDFSLYDNALGPMNHERGTSRNTEMDSPQEVITIQLIDGLRKKKRKDKGEITYFLCVKKLSSEFCRSKFLHFLINYVMNNLGNNVNKAKVEIKQSTHLICLILQLLSYQIIFIDNKNEILKLANVLIKYIKKKDPCLVTTYYIILFFNSCFINSSLDERIITLLFSFEKNDNIWFNLIFLQNSKIKRSKEILLLIKFSILHLYLLLLKNKNSFKKCILCISGDLNIYFVFIYVLNEIYEYFKSCNIECSPFRATNINQHEKSKNENTKREKYNKYFYLYAELLVIITEMIKIMNTNDVNKYITIQHNKEKDNLVLQFKNLYRKIKNELKQFEQSIKLIKYLIFIHPLMINIHELHKFYLCIYIKEYHYFHKEFFKYDMFLADYLSLLRDKRKAKISNMGTAQRGSEGKETGKVSSETAPKQTYHFSNDGMTKKDNKDISPHALVDVAQKGTTFEKDNMHFYFFFNTPKNYNYQVNNLCSSILQNEFQGSLSKFFSSSSNRCDNSDTRLQYNTDQIKIYAHYIHDSVNYAIEFFSSF